MPDFDTYGYAPCEFEDSPGPCYWDASTMGNGIGNSFVVHADGSVEYIEYPPALPLDGADTLAETGPLEVGILLTLGAVLMVVGFVLRRFLS